jgi:hypothetical protein
MFMTLKSYIGFLILASCVLAGCRTKQPSIERAALVGTYVYHSEDPEGRSTDHEWDRLTLQGDGKYDLVQGGPTKPRTETVGTWTLYPWTPTAHGPEVDLDHGGYPIEVNGNQVRLLIDEDTAIWYAKVK